MNKPLLILFILIGSLAFGQNLVHNGDFEIYDDCPSALSGPSDLQIEKAIGWYAPTLGTSDYFNRCADQASGVGIPNNFLGFQETNGNGYSGINISIAPLGVDWFEYLQIRLNSSLNAGSLYKFKFDVNLANTSHFALQKIGAWFTKDAVYSNSSGRLFHSMPNITNSNGFLSDTIEWQSIEGEFIASGDEKYLTIGCYSDTLNIDTLRIISGPISIYTYYFIDGVELTEVLPKLNVPNVFTPNNDGVNDILIFKNLEGVYDFTISILNRWGNRVYFGENELNWDGNTQSGEPVTGGTYFYTIEYNSKEVKNGFVQVIR